MEQPIFGTFRDQPVQNATEYNFACGGEFWQSSEVREQSIVSTLGKISKLRVKLDVAPGAGTSYQFTIMLNGVASALDLTISDAATSGSDEVNEVIVAGGDTLSIRCIPTGSLPLSVYPRWSYIFTGDNANESLILGSGGATSVVPTQTRYEAIMVGGSGYSSGEGNKQQVIPTNGTLKNLYISLNTSPGTDPDAYRFTLRVNGTDTALTVTITAPATSGSDTMHEVTVVPGDLVSLQVEPLNVPASNVRPSHGLTFVADTDGESIILGSTPINLVATVYAKLCSSEEPLWQATDILIDCGQLTTLKSLYINLVNAPGVGTSRTFTVRQNNADTALAVSIVGVAKTGNDIVNEVAISALDDISMKHTLNGLVANAGRITWGLVAFLAVVVLPTVTTDPATSVKGVSATLNGTLDDDGGEACDCGFEYGLTTSYGTTTPTQSKETAEAFSQAITGLLPYRTYHFRAIATNSAGTTYGSDVTFKTKIYGDIHIDQLKYQHAERMAV